MTALIMFIVTLICVCVLCVSCDAARKKRNLQTTDAESVVRTCLPFL